MVWIRTTARAEPERPLRSNASPTAVRNALVDNATAGVVKSAGRGSPNKLLYSLVP